VLWRGAKSYCQAAEFMLHIYLKRLRKGAGEYVLHCDGSLKGLASLLYPGLNKNAQMRAILSTVATFAIHMM
jgi:hypothetical protein